MKYRVGDMLVVNTEVRPNGRRYVLVREPTPEAELGHGVFQVVAKDEVMMTYKIILDDDMVGWQISQFHIEHERVPKAFKGKKFWDLHEDFIVSKKE